MLGVIPARGGSKGIPGKNIRPLAGKPLIAWTIEAARASKRLDRFVVSTEDAGIARVARRWGAEVLPRPGKLATDKAGTWAVLRHVLKEIPADAVVLLQPTSPVRSPGLIDRCVRRFFRKKTDSVATGFWCKFREYGTYSARRQDMEGFFYDDGNVYVVRPRLIREDRRTGRRTERVFTSRGENVEIDELFDFWLAEQILSKGGRHVR